MISSTFFIGVNMAQPKKKEKIGALTGTNVMDILNKKAGRDVAFDLTTANPTAVTSWIPTGSKWLDSIICKGKEAGIPVGKIVEIAGLEASGKSYLAAIIAANAQKIGMKVIVFDSESSIDPEFLQKLGIDLNANTYTYVQAESVEFVFETIETLLATEQDILYIWDSFANTPCKADMEDESFDPSSSMARKARIASLAMQKLTLPIANANSTLLVLNQLRTNLNTSDPSAMKMEPFITPGGKALVYAYSLRIWLTGRKAKDSYVKNDKEFRIGSEVKAKLKKSRFGTEGRECAFKIVWGDDPVGIRDEESWQEALELSGAIQTAGAWKTITAKDGTAFKFQSAMWMDKMKEPKFRETVLQLIDEEVIQKYQNKTGSASLHFDVDRDEIKKENV